MSDKFAVRIKGCFAEDPSFRIEWTDESLPVAVALCLHSGVDPRASCHVVADVVRLLAEWSGKKREHWPGYLKAYDEFVDAAQKLIEGWEEHDKQMHAAVEVYQQTNGVNHAAPQ